MIVNICLKMSDPSNPNYPPVNSIISFIRLGGSEKVSKNINEMTGEKFQENIIVNADYSCLQRLVYGLFTGQKKYSLRLK